MINTAVAYLHLTKFIYIFFLVLGPRDFYQGRSREQNANPDFQNLQRNGSRAIGETLCWRCHCQVNILLRKGLHLGKSRFTILIRSKEWQLSNRENSLLVTPFSGKDTIIF